MHLRSCGTPSTGQGETSDVPVSIDKENIKVDEVVENQLMVYVATLQSCGPMQDFGTKLQESSPTSQGNVGQVYGQCF